MGEYGRGFFHGILVTIIVIPVLFIVLYLTNPSAMGRFAGAVFAASNPYSETLDGRRLITTLNQINTLIDDAYVADSDAEIDQEEMTDSLLAGYVRGLGDRYSVYYSKEGLEALQQSNDGEYVGIGATVSETEEGAVRIEEIKKGSPAEKAGLLAGDIITAYDGTLTSETSLADLTSHIRASSGVEVVLDVLRGSEERKITLVPSALVMETAAGEMIEDSIGYLAIAGFNNNTVEQVEAALNTLIGQGMQGLVIDLRDNPGGTLYSVTEIAEYFLSDDLIFYVQEKDGTRTDYRTREGALWDGPTVVLVNGGSASASEVFTGMMKDHGLATIVGTQTFGKGIMQSSYVLAGETGIKLTTAHYYTPSGADIHKVGIEPDILVEEDGGKDDGVKGADATGGNSAGGSGAGENAAGNAAEGAAAGENAAFSDVQLEAAIQEVYRLIDQNKTENIAA